MKLIYLIFCFLMIGCQSKPSFQFLKDFTQGTTYHITVQSNNHSLKHQIDSLLNRIDNELSTYQENSVISTFNQAKTPFEMNVKNAPLFRACFEYAKTFYHQTNGYFNPTISPVLKKWGFKNDKKNDAKLVVDFSDTAVFIKAGIIHKKRPINLDFNAHAQGFSVDVIAEHFDKLNIKHYCVEIGGEIRTKGQNPKGKRWRIGIDAPQKNTYPGEVDFQKILTLNNQSLATSGNYRKFIEKNGKTYGHTINPHTLNPAQNSLLSVSVIGDKCVVCDAYATAFMSMGKRRTMDFLKRNKSLNLSVFLVFKSREPRQAIETIIL